MSSLRTQRVQRSQLKNTASFLDSIGEEELDIGHIHKETSIVPLENPAVLGLPVFDNLSKTLPDRPALVSDDDEKREQTISDKFDSLSEQLGIQAVELDEDVAEQERLLRGKVVESLKNFKAGETDLGKSLYEYRTVYKGKRQWTSVATKIAHTMECSSRTLYRLIDDYEASLSPKPAPVAEFDRATIDGPALSQQERRERAARLAIRTFLNNTPKQKRLEILADLLAQEAYQVWGERNQFRITVVPKQSKFTIDGRKRNGQSQSEENAA